MKWTLENLIEVRTLLKEGKTYGEIAILVGRSHNSVRVFLNKNGESYLKNRPENSDNLCEHCNSPIVNYGIRFCSSSCSASFFNKNRGRQKEKCLNCDNLVRSNESHFCSNLCRGEFERKSYDIRIESGEILNNRLSKRYLINKFGEKCMECGWCEINQTSGKIPIELEHIDGNSENNKLENLKLLCPNCHSLTPTYKFLNKGNGRHSRMVRYNNGQSY